MKGPGSGTGSGDLRNIIDLHPDPKRQKLRIPSEHFWSTKQTYHLNDWPKELPHGSNDLPTGLRPTWQIDLIDLAYSPSVLGWYTWLTELGQLMWLTYSIWLIYLTDKPDRPTKLTLPDWPNWLNYLTGTDNSLTLLNNMYCALEEVPYCLLVIS
jgi:hypothetical protein